MQVSVENLSEIERKIKIVFPVDAVDPKVNTRLQEFAKNAKVEGFRKGKLNMRALRTLSYGKHIREQVVNELAYNALQDACKEHSLQLASQADIHFICNLEGQPLECEFTLEIIPEIILTDLSALTIERETAEVKEIDIEKTIKGMREQQATFKPTDHPALMGDRVILEFRGSINGEVFPGGEGKGLAVILGKQQVIPDFEKGLLGLELNVEKTFPVKFPDDYGAAELAGKDAEFWVKATEIETPELPPLDDAFAAKLGIKEGGLQKLREEIKLAMQREIKRATHTKLKNKLLEKLLELHPANLPQTLLENEARQVRAEAVANMQRYDRNAPRYSASQIEAIDLAGFMDEAKRRVHTGVLLSTIIKQREIKLDQDKLREKLHEMAEMYQETEKAEQMILKDRDRLSELQSAVLEEQIIEVLLADVQLVDKVMGYEELIKG